MRSISLMVVVALLAGCSSGEPTFVWDKRGATEADMRRDDARCRNEGVAIAGLNPYARAVVVYQNCMIAAGWTRTV